MINQLETTAKEVLENHDSISASPSLLRRKAKNPMLVYVVVSFLSGGRSTTDRSF